MSATPDVDTGWVDKLTSPRSKRIELPGLVSGKRYGVRVAAVGAAGQGPWSDVVLQYAH